MVEALALGARQCRFESGLLYNMGKNAKQSYFVKQSSAMIVIDKVTSQSICKIDVWPNKPFPTKLDLIKPLLKNT